MKMLVTGRNGQVGWELQRALAPLGEVVACGRDAADLERPDTLAALVDSIKPDVIVNAAAYTAVDQAEQDEAVALCVNGESVGVLAESARRHGALMVHYSTDYVFDGTANRPYLETDGVAPLNAYGRTKLAGEQAIAAAGGDHLTFRTTWVYGVRGKNFLKTMLRLAGEREQLRVVADQIGAPTPARMIADLTAHAVAQALRERRADQFTSGLFNMTAAGQTSWHGFASAIIDTARKANPETVKVRDIDPIPADAYPTPTKRPQNSVLDNSAFEQRFQLHRLDWHEAMTLVMGELMAI